MPCIYGHSRTSNKFYTGKIWCYNDKNYEENIKRIHYFISKLEHELEDIVSNTNVDLDIMNLVFSKILFIVKHVVLLLEPLGNGTNVFMKKLYIETFFFRKPVILLF